jgi:glycosyltransferase involved in cell wall biosynthesis
VKVCALVAALNEESTVGTVVTLVRRHVPDVVVVDDGSSDRTADCARAAGATTLRHDRNRGKGAAVRTGLAHVLAGTWTHVLLIDADLQHDPDDIPLLIGAAERDGWDVVIAERAFARGSMPAPRYYSNRIGSRILSWFIGSRVADTQSGFRLIRTDCLRHLSLTSTGYEIETEMLIKLARHHASIGRVSIRPRYQGSSSKLRSIRDTFRTCMLAVWYRYLDRDRATDDRT